MSSQEPPSKKQKTPKTDEDRDGTLLLEEKPLPLMDAGEVESTLEGVKVMCTEASQVEKLGEPSLPFVDDYNLGQYYYIRECYDEYYTLVKEMLDNERTCVTVTGTPGIGKSIFYAYFFQHLQREMKEKNLWIIAGAYKRRELEAAFIYKDSSDDGEMMLSVEDITDCIRMARTEKKRVILLSDGPPTRTWGWTQMVVFTSPNDSWLRSVRKDNCTLYMPLWTLTELQEAAEMLTLQGRDGSCITDEVIEKRFYTFGGVARECFYLSEDLVQKKRNDLVEKIGAMSKLEDVWTLLCGNENAAVCHRILQFEAAGGKRTATSLASPFIVEELGKRMLEIVGGKREELIQSFQIIPEGAALAGWTFKVGVHDTLARDCKLQLRPLPSDVPTPGSQDTSTFENLSIKEGETDEFTLKGLSALTATKGPYHKPKSKQFESIDGFYIPKMEPGNNLEETKRRLIEWNEKPENRLILVQPTISESHPVNASGILDVLEKLGLKEAVKAHPERAALVFIVPEPNVATYKRQEIRPERYGGLTSVKHIGRHTEKALHKRGIFSINQLLELVANNSNVVSNKVRNSLSNLRYESDSDAMTKIPQFVCCLPRSETTKLDKLEELGFMDRKLNSVVLEQYGGDLPLVVKILTRRSVEKSHRKADH